MKLVNIAGGEIAQEGLDRIQFYRKYCGIDLLDYMVEQDGGRFIRFGDFQCDLLDCVLRAYVKNADFLADANIDVERYVNRFVDAFGDGATKVPPVVFDRDMLKEIAAAHGDDIAKWFTENLTEATDQLIEFKDNPKPSALAAALTASNLLVISAVAATAFIGYQALTPAAPLAFLPGVAQGVATFIAANPAAAVAIIAGAVIINSIITLVAILQRELTGLIINDTPYDVEIDSWYMKHGYMDALMCLDETLDNRPMIKHRQADNMVYAAFYTISKNSTALVGTECTMKIRVGSDRERGSLFYLSANPLSETSRVNIKRVTGRDSYSLRPQDVTAELYDSGVLEMEGELGDIGYQLRLNSEHGSKAFAVLLLSSERRESIDFTTKEPAELGRMRVAGSEGFAFNADAGCYELSPGGHVAVNASAGTYNRYSITCKAGTGSAQSIDFFFGNPVSKLTCPLEGDDFSTYSFSNQPAQHDNADILDIVQFGNSSSDSIWVSKIENHPSFSAFTSRSSWMEALGDDVALADINIPGSHDAAAINAVMHTPYACHHSSIAKQLKFGIRAFDIRIKVKEKGSGFTFVTCHGSFGGGSWTVNEYQPLDEVFGAFARFLEQHPSETLIVLLKIDDPAKLPAGREEEVYAALSSVLGAYPVRAPQRELGCLGQARGKIVLFNRITQDNRFGYVVGWSHNTDGEYAKDAAAGQCTTRDFKVYVQDHFQMEVSMGGEDLAKFHLVQRTAERLSPGDGVACLNYASACKLLVLGVYCQGYLLEWLGALPPDRRPKRFGWVFMDYEDDTYPTDVYGNLDFTAMLISSNFAYEGFASTFKRA